MFNASQIQSGSDAQLSASEYAAASTAPSATATAASATPANPSPAVGEKRTVSEEEETDVTPQKRQRRRDRYANDPW